MQAVSLFPLNQYYSHWPLQSEIVLSSLISLDRSLCLVAWPLNGSEAGVELLIETSLLFLC